MTAANHPPARARGVLLVLAHCDRVGRLDPARVSARRRLEAELGPELTRFLLGALRRDDRRRSTAARA